MKRCLRWLLRLFSFGIFGKPPLAPDKRDTPALPETLPPPKGIVTLLIFPTITDDIEFNKSTEVGGDTYYLSSPWDVNSDKVNKAIQAANDWLATALGTRITWNLVRTINSQRSISQWRSGKIRLIKEEVSLLGLPWTDDYIYLAFVRGMGGYAGGIRYQRGEAGYAMVGDVCLEAICEYPASTAGSVLLGDKGWPPNSYSLIGQTGAFIHEALHGLDLPHPDGWPGGHQPDWDETLMGNWWNMPNFTNTKGLTKMEIEQVLRWAAPESDAGDDRSS